MRFSGSARLLRNLAGNDDVSGTITAILVQRKLDTVEVNDRVVTSDHENWFQQPIEVDLVDVTLLSIAPDFNFFIHPCSLQKNPLPAHRHVAAAARRLTKPRRWHPAAIQAGLRP